MTSEQFSRQIVDMMQTLYRVSCMYLSQSCDRDDAVQDCLYKAWKKRNQLKEECYMRTWVIRILINECYNVQKRKRNEVALYEIEAEEQNKEIDYDLKYALLQLEENLRVPIVLHYIEGFKVHEIAKILSLPQGTVKTRMRQGRIKLKKVLE